MQRGYASPCNVLMFVNTPWVCVFLPMRLKPIAQSPPTHKIRNSELNIGPRILGLVRGQDFGGVGMRFIDHMHMQWHIC